MRAAELHPPEELLIAPEQHSEPTDEGWAVIARNSRVNDAWNAVIAAAPEDASRWYNYLRTQPTQRYPGRVFPLKGSIFQGVWECEVGRGHRIYYIPNEADRTVLVFYAGPHPKNTPRPPR